MRWKTTSWCLWISCMVSLASFSWHMTRRSENNNTIPGKCLADDLRPLNNKSTITRMCAMESLQNLAHATTALMSLLVLLWAYGVRGGRLLWNFELWYSNPYWNAILLYIWVRSLSMAAQGLNSLRPSDAIWRHRSVSTLAQVMACCLTKPLPEPMLTYHQ